MKRLFTLTIMMLTLAVWAQEDTMHPFKIAANYGNVDEGKWYVIKNASNGKYLSTNGGLVSEVDVNANTELWRVERSETAGDYEYWHLLTATEDHDNSYWKYVDYGSKTWDGFSYDGYDWYNYAGFNGEFGSKADAQDIRLNRVMINSSVSDYQLLTKEKYQYNSDGSTRYYSLDCQGNDVGFAPWRQAVRWMFYEVIPRSETNKMVVVYKDGTKITNSGCDIIFRDNEDGTFNWGYADDSGQHWGRGVADIEEIRPVSNFTKSAVLVCGNDSSTNSGVFDTSEPVNFYIAYNISDFIPIDDMNRVVWTSSDETVATLASPCNSTNVVTMTGKEGYSIISAIDDAGTALTYKLTYGKKIFFGNEVLVNDNDLSTGEGTVIYGDTKNVFFYVGDKSTGQPLDGYQWVKWASSNTRVATVEALPEDYDPFHAIAVVKGPGTTYITGSDIVGNKIQYKLVVVNRHNFPSNVVLVEADNYDIGSATVNIANKQTVTLYIGDRSNGQPYAPFSWATWSVSNPEVASIMSTNTSDDNHITLKLLKAGETTITASNEDGRDNIRFKLTVTRN